MSSKIKLAIILVLLVGLFSIGETTPKYTESEQLAIRKLRSLVENYLYRDFMKEDAYLLRFLKVRDMDVNEANKLLRETINWRKENRIDSILEEEILTFPIPAYYTDGFDDTGSPVAAFIPSRIDVRKFVVSGKSDVLNRFFDQFLEYGEFGIRSLGQNNSAITQGNSIIDLDGYNLRQHACLGCIACYMTWIRHYENYYPGLCKNLLFINTPRIFIPMLEILKPIMSKATRNVLKVFGPNQQEWVPFLQKFIRPNQLRRKFGGTMPEY